jgi:hypothetical protein
MAMVWKEPETRKTGSGTAEMIAGKGGRSLAACVEELKEGMSAGVLVCWLCCVVRKCSSEPSHNTKSCESSERTQARPLELVIDTAIENSNRDDRRSTRHITAAWLEAQWTTHWPCLLRGV